MNEKEKGEIKHMERELRCHKVLITGGDSGIGLAIAARLLSAGASVVIAGRSEQKLAAALEKLDSPRAFALQWDVSQLASWQNKFDEVVRLMDGLDGLVNGAAIGTDDLTGRGYDPWDITEEEYDKLTAVNLKGAYFMMRNTVDYMVKNQIRGNILTISSNAACMDIVGTYGFSKLSLLRLTRAWGKRFAENGIIINGIAPGATFTPIIRRYAKHIDDPYPRHGLGRFIRPEEIAELAAYLMSPWGEIICGHTVVADAGDRCATL